jgi:hypothetical protein
LYRWNTGTSAYVELSPNIVSSLVFNDANGFDGTINLVGSVATLTITTALTTGSVGFIGASGALLQDNANFFWDDTNNRLGLGTNAPTTALDVFGSGIIGRLNATSTNNAYLGFASAGTNKWSVGNVQSDHRFRIFSEANSAELITVLQTGEFGIGIANPTTKLHIDGGASALIANLDANVSVAKSVSFRSDNSARINLEVSGTESGANAGADFFLRTFTDAGSLLATPLTITRSTGAVAFSNSVTFAASVINFVGSSKLFGGNGSTFNYLYTGTTSLSIQNQADTATVASISNTGAASFSGELSIASGLLSISGSGATPPTSGVGLRFVSNRLLIYGGSSDITFQKNSNASANMTILESGNVGIATTALTPIGSASNRVFALSGPSGAAAQMLLQEGSLNYGVISAYGADMFISSVSTIPLIFGTNTTERMRILSGGNIAIGNSGATDVRVFVTAATSGSSAYTFFLRNSSSANLFYVRDDGVINTGTTAGSPYNNTSGTAANMVVTSSGFLERSTSSIKYKTDIVNYDKGLAEVLKMRPVYYKSINEREKNLRFAGLIAEEIEELGLTEFVQYAKDGSPDALAYSNMVALLVKAIQEQQAQIEELKAK